MLTRKKRQEKPKRKDKGNMSARKGEKEISRGAKCNFLWGRTGPRPVDRRASTPLCYFAIIDAPIHRIPIRMGSNAHISSKNGMVSDSKKPLRIFMPLLYLYVYASVARVQRVSTP